MLGLSSQKKPNLRKDAEGEKSVSKTKDLSYKQWHFNHFGCRRLQDIHPRELIERWVLGI